MAIDLDDEILQDFLVEAGEILELLGEQLVQLEQSPNDLELLNAIFRGFHTIKGGAGFLAIDPLVEICHSAEDVFNILRQGDRKVTPDLMDVILKVLDVVNEMFGNVRSGKQPESAGEKLLKKLKSFASVDQPTTDENPVQEETQNHVVVEDIEQSPEPQSAEQATANSQIISGLDSDEITEQEFEELLDVLHGKGELSVTVPSAPSTTDDDITEEEFEKVLDELHGKGKFSAPADHSSSPENTANSGDITEAEFEQYLDDLYGKGKFDAGKIAEDTPAPKETPVLDTKPEAVKVISVKPEIEATVPEIKPNKIIAVEKDAPLDSTSEKPNKSAPAVQADTTVRVDTQVLDDIMNMVGELVLVRNRFQTLKATAEAGEQLSKAISNLDVVTADLQLAVMKTRMQPIKKVFGRFPRVVRDLARSLKKEIRLELVGEDTDLDKNLVEALADPLVHLVRNAVDHGIEAPEIREANGKPKEGVVILKASQEGDHIQLSIKDDGKGMNPDKLRAKVVDMGLMDEESAARLDNKECFNLIFLPGFSTKTEISDVSGRGVGMDVVKTRITQMNGVVEIDSIEGKGSTIIIKVPLTLAIMPTLMVKLGGQAFALPLASVLEILDLDLSKTNKVDGQLVAMVRNKALPLFYLSQWLVKDIDTMSDEKLDGHVVVVNAGGRQVGFVVDQLIGQEEVVIKALGAKLHGLEGLSGATITGDGKIALILDVPGLMKKYAN